MSDSYVLIQLVSEQTMPNVLAVLAVRPMTVVLFHTKRTAHQVAWIKDALKAGGLSPFWEIQEISDASDIRGTGSWVTQAIERALQAQQHPIVNFTGGTKLMSIGAFAACHRVRCPSFYVDTDHGQLQDGQTGLLPEALAPAIRNLKSFLGSLSIDALSLAHGVNLTPGLDPSRFGPIARLLFQDHELERASHDWVQSIRPRGHGPRDLLNLVDTQLDSIPDAMVEPLHAAEVIELRDGHWHLVCAQDTQLGAWAEGHRFDRLDSFFSVADTVYQALNLLEGGWWELSVLEAAKASVRFQEIRCSVQRSAVGRGQPIEEDLVASDGLQLALFSCRRGGERARLLGALDELDSAGRQLGGSYCSRFLCLALPVPGAYLEEVQSRTRRSRISIVGPASRLQASLFRNE